VYPVRGTWDEEAQAEGRRLEEEEKERLRQAEARRLEVEDELEQLRQAEAQRLEEEAMERLRQAWLEQERQKREEDEASQTTVSLPEQPPSREETPSASLTSTAFVVAARSYEKPSPAACPVETRWDWAVTPMQFDLEAYLKTRTNPAPQGSSRPIHTPSDATPPAARDSPMAQLLHSRRQEILMYRGLRQDPYGGPDPYGDNMHDPYAIQDPRDPAMVAAAASHGMDRHGSHRAPRRPQMLIPSHLQSAPATRPQYGLIYQQVQPTSDQNEGSSRMYT